MIDPADDASKPGSRPLEAQVGGVTLERRPFVFAALQSFKGPVCEHIQGSLTDSASRIRDTVIWEQDL